MICCVVGCRLCCRILSHVDERLSHGSLSCALRRTLGAQAAIRLLDLEEVMSVDISEQELDLSLVISMCMQSMA